MKPSILIRYTLTLFMLTLGINLHQVQAEPQNCYKIKKGKRHYIPCNHACSTDPKGSFNAEGRCSCCGHLVKKRPDFYIKTGVKS